MVHRSTHSRQWSVHATMNSYCLTVPFVAGVGDSVSSSLERSKVLRASDAAHSSYCSSSIDLAKRGRTCLLGRTPKKPRRGDCSNCCYASGTWWTDWFLVSVLAHGGRQQSLFTPVQQRIDCRQLRSRHASDFLNVLGNEADKGV